MSEHFQLVRLVSGNSGSKRITIPKEIVEKLELHDAKYVAVMYEGNKRAIITPVKVVIQEEESSRKTT